MKPWMLLAGGAVLAGIAVVAARSMGPVSVLVWSTGRYVVKPSDRLWLLRAVQAESNKPEDRRRVAQTLLNRFVFLKSRGSTAYPTLTSFVRAYAQPINPRWQSADTPKCLANPRFCTEAMLAKRQTARNQTQFSDSTVFAVDEALSQGMTVADESSVHYAAPGIGSDGKIRLTPDVAGYNTFWAVSSSQGWPGYAVA